MTCSHVLESRPGSLTVGLLLLLLLAAAAAVGVHIGINYAGVVQLFGNAFAGPQSYKAYTQRHTTVSGATVSV
jgi:hypothetical protein